MSSQVPVQKESREVEHGLDPARIAAVVGLIPAGRWMSYGDVAAACGGTSRHARTLNQHFIRRQVEGAHRVLTADGAVSATALGDANRVRARLEAEGVVFSKDRACPDARLRPRALAHPDTTGSQARPAATMRNGRPRRAS